MSRRPTHDASPPRTISLDGLIVRLQNAGFQLRPDDYAEILQVITTFSPRTPDELAERIAPLLVTSEEEQQRFYALFAEEQRSGQPVVPHPPKHRPWFVWTVLAGLVAVGLLAWWRWPKSVPVQETTTTQPDSTSVISPPPNESDTATVPPERHLVVVSSSGDVNLSKLVNPYHLWGPIVLGLLCAGMGTYLLRRARRRVRRGADGGDGPDLTTRFGANQPPYELPLPNREAELVQPTSAFNTVVQTLRQRSEDESTTLNIRRTLSATLRSGGLPDLVFSHRLREEEFVFLIDGSRSRSLQRHLFEYYFHALCREGVHAERFFYRVPFGLVYNDRFPDGLRLDQLATRYANSTLLLWGDGYPLLFDDSDVLLPTYLPDLRRFDRRAILTPVPFADLTYRERALQSEFVLLPADLPGQLRLMQALRDNRPDQTTYLETCRGMYSTEDVSFRRVSEVKTYLADDDLFQWLCATAVYGKVRWEVVIEMGNAVLPDPKKLTYTNLLKLARISWLNEGIFPDKLRFELLKELRPDTERKTRERLLDLLYYADVRYPDGYFFDEERYLLRTTNQFVLHRHDPSQYASYAAAAQEYEQLWRTNQLPDGTTGLYLNNPDAAWDNLLGEGHARVRLGEQLTTEATSESRWQKGWQFNLGLNLIGLATLLWLYAGYVNWQKPTYALQERQIPYAFQFVRNQCLLPLKLQEHKYVILKINGVDKLLDFNGRENSTDTVMLPFKQLPAGLVNVSFTTGISEYDIKYPVSLDLSKERHVLEMRGDGCDSLTSAITVTKDYKLEFFYFERVRNGMKLSDSIRREVLRNRYNFRDTTVRFQSINFSVLSPAEAIKLNVTTNQIRFDNGNVEEQDIATDLQSQFNNLPMVKDRGIRFGLSRVMYQKSPNYISVFIVDDAAGTVTTPPASLSGKGKVSSRPRAVPSPSKLAVQQTAPPEKRPTYEVTVPDQTTPPKKQTPYEITTPNTPVTNQVPSQAQVVALATNLNLLDVWYYQMKNSKFQLVGDAQLPTGDQRVTIYLLPNLLPTRLPARQRLQGVSDDLLSRLKAGSKTGTPTIEVAEDLDQLDEAARSLLLRQAGWEKGAIPAPPAEYSEGVWVAVFGQRARAFAK
ncbi:hypothetical protein [Fibrella aquatilis]|uniref:Uncharacterized protein n=1 Tax=Fibrella aquatilis TaxID=2817059 RepID=A0A939K0Z9_9BACT|nr:hypothetical protein [Fibrella aquatilis]MBO0932531.1 hypothetical protein [Fibrella aquatilis]